MAFLLQAHVLLGLAALAKADFYGGPGVWGGYDGPYGSDNSDGSYGRASLFGGNQAAFLSSAHKVVIAHAVLASTAFVLLFPVGAILVRLGNFRGLWLVHALFQLFSYLVYIAAFGLGVYITTHVRVIDNAHPIIGIILLILLFFQPILGFLHHMMFKKHSRRVVWSYGHVWLGRILITLGIINGGLGLQLARRIGAFAPPRSAIIAYSVVAGVMWLVYVGAAIYGEVRSRNTAKHPPHKKSTDTLPETSRGLGEDSKTEHGRYA